MLSRRNKAKNPNTSRAWDKLLKTNRHNLTRSPVFQDKNDWVLGRINGIDQKVLDIGFGYGYLERKIVISKKRINLFGLDISGFAVSEAKKNIRGNFIKGNILRIPFENNCFDYVVVLDVLEHIGHESVGRALSEVHRVIKKGGTLIVSVPLNETFHDKKNNLHVRKYTFNVLASELGRAGFKIYSQRYLFAFESLYRIKSIISRLFNLSKPNLLLIEAIKI